MSSILFEYFYGTQNPQLSSSCVRIFKICKFYGNRTRQLASSLYTYLQAYIDNQIEPHTPSFHHIPILILLNLGLKFLG